MSNTNSAIANHGNLVAGAAAEGHGVLVGWAGRGDMTRSRLLELAAAAGIPASWCPPPKQAATQLTRAIRAATGSSYTAESPSRAPGPTERPWASRWLLVSRVPASGAPLAPGAAYGEVALVATLFADGALVIESPNDLLAEQVRAEFTSRVGAERYVAADVTAWLSTVLRERLDAVKYGGCWYVPRGTRAQAEALVEVFRGTWGRDWIYPAIPVATGAQLAMGLALGLEAEVAEVVARLAADRDRARRQRDEALAGNPETRLRGDVGPDAAESYMVQLRIVGERVVAYEEILGMELVEDVKIHIHDAMVELDALLEERVDFASEWARIDMERRARGVLA